jgi:probable F420-dependent oxidoreductase
MRAMATTPLMIGVGLGGAHPQGVPAPATLIAAARHAEAAGYDAIWCGDHVMMYSPITEPATLLSAFASVTTRVALGTAVYLLPLRHPVIAAKLFAGVDYVSNGRLIFGVGVGGEYPREFEACGVPVKERGSRTDEALEIVRRLWTETGVTFEGRYYRVQDVTLAPPPVQRPHPPIWIGGRSDAALRRTARAGSGWLAYMASPRRIRESMDRVRGFAADAGRDGSGIAAGLLLFAHVAADRAAARARVLADLAGRYHQSFETLVDRYCAFGSPAQCAETIAPFVDAGVRNIAIKFTCTPAEQTDQQAAFAEAVMPALRALA